MGPRGGPHAAAALIVSADPSDASVVTLGWAAIQDIKILDSSSASSIEVAPVGDRRRKPGRPSKIYLASCEGQVVCVPIAYLRPKNAGKGLLNLRPRPPS